MTIKRNWAIT